MAAVFDLVRTIYTCCASASFTLGVLSNLLLLWLIARKTPSPMRVYSRLMVAPCLMDLSFVVFTFLVQPITVSDHGYFVVIQNGFFRNLSRFYNYSANVLWFQMLLLFVCVKTVQFVFRYYVITSEDGRIPLKLKYVTGISLTILLVTHVLLHYLSDFPSDAMAPEMAHLAEIVNAEVGLTEIRFSSFTQANSQIWLLHCAVMLSIFGICYGIIVCTTIGTIRYIGRAFAKTGLKAADAKKNERMRRYNNQITSAFIVQALLPTLDVLELSVQTTVPIFLPHGLPVKYMVYAALPLYFIPVLNPLVSMLLVKPYRASICKLLSGHNFASKSQVSVTPITELPAGRMLSHKDRSHSDNTMLDNVMARVRRDSVISGAMSTF